MLKRVGCLLLTLVLLCSLVGVLPAYAEGETMVTSDDAIELLKSMEGFSKYPYYDYSQYSVGYGTRCPDADYYRYCVDGITEEEAEQLLRTYLAGTEKTLNNFQTKNGITLTQNQFDALILFSYNCGSGWVNENYKITNAVKNGTTGNDFIYAISMWCNAGGNISDILVDRRMCEANIYLNGIYSKTPPANYCYVLYNAQGGTLTGGERIQGFDAEQGIAPVPAATYSGKTFAGWYTLDGQKVTVLTEELHGTTLYAHWGEEGEVADPSYTLPEGGLEITVTGSYVNIRVGPGTNYSIATGADYGEKLTITETFDSGDYVWGKCDEGWISLYYTNFEEALAGAGESEPEIITGTVVGTNNLRVRTEPSYDASIVGYLTEGTVLTIIELKEVDGETWAKIADGWVSMEYVKLDGETEEPEETQPTEPEVTEPEVTEPPAEPETSAPTTEPTTEPTEPPAEEPAGLMGTIINASALRVRSGAGTGYEIVGYLYTGDRVEILEQTTVGTTPWGRVASGWISMDYVKLDETASAPETSDPEPEAPAVPETPEEEPAPSTKSGKVTASALCVRNGAGFGASVIGTLYEGDAVEILEIKDADGMTWGRISGGWISMTYVELDSDATETPDSGSTSGTKTGTVTASELCVRSGAGTGNSVLGYLYKGTKVEILESKTVSGMMWGRISSGWICLDYVELDDETSGTTRIGSVNTDYLNIRQGPGTGYSAIGGYTYGNKVEILEEKDVNGTTWGRTSKGWICLDYVI